MISENPAWWAAFIAFVLAMLVLDLKVFHREAHAVRVREALYLTAFWIGLALAFNVMIYVTRGHDPAIEFLTGYIIEKSLSVDNLFVFALIFRYFNVDDRYQHKVLAWGIIGALIMRAIFIFLGVALIQKLDWIIYVFGAFLIVTAVRLARETEKEIHPERNPVLRLVRRIFPIAPVYDGEHFRTTFNGRRMFTPMFVVLVAIETTDLIFAVDSIPAILAITLDPFIVFTSNVFAILGLRALYFALAGMMRMFDYLHYGLAVVLGFVGFKMVAHKWVHIPTPIALGVVLGVIALSVWISVAKAKKEGPIVDPDEAPGA
ncbi:TerC family protein [bacterium]|nr:TerC family protein [bacterium]